MSKTYSYVVYRYPWIKSECGRCRGEHGGSTLGFQEKIAEFNNAHDAVIWMEQVRENKYNYFYTIDIQVL